MSSGASSIRQVSVEKAHARPTEVTELEIVIAELHLLDEGPDTLERPDVRRL